MEDRLKALFELQHFAMNPALDRVIRETEERIGGRKELADTDVEFLAAGAMRMPSDWMKK